MTETAGNGADRESTTAVRAHQLTSVDAQFLALEDSHNYAHVSGLIVLDPSTAPGGAVTLADLQRRVEQRLYLLPPFRWRLQEVPLKIDIPYWVGDPDFDLEFHVRELALPAPGNDAQLAAQVERIFSRPLDRLHPLWELYLIQGLSGGRIALLTKVHHAVVDGVSSLELFGTLFDSGPDEELPPEPEPEEPEKARSPLELLARGVLNVPERMLASVGDLPGILPRIVDFPPVRETPVLGRLGQIAERVNLAGNRDREGHVLRPPDVKAPHCSLNGPVSAHRRFSFGSLSLGSVRKVKDAFGATVNDVVVSLSAAGLREFLIDRGELPEQPLVALIPMSIRTRDEARTFGNRVTGMFVPIPTDEPDPVERLRACHAELSRGKDYYGSLPTDLVTDLMNFIPPPLFGRAVRAGTARATAPESQPLFNVTISNIPGSRVPNYMLGALIEALFPVSVVTDGMLVNITVLSYRDHIDFGVVGDRDLAADYDALIESMRHELETLERLAIQAD